MVIEDVAIEAEVSRAKTPTVGEVLVFSVRPKATQAGRCSRCRKRCAGYDGGDATRRWRTLDVGSTKAYLQAAAPRVQCPEDGVVVAHVPWARPGSKHIWAFEDTCAWLAAHTALSVLTVFLRIAWRTVDGIVTRVVADGRDTNDLLAGLVRIGIDEISYRKGQRYLTVIVDHGSSRLVWAREGRNQETLGAFFDALGPERTTLLTHVSCDGAEWIHALVRARAPGALICLDPFYADIRIMPMWCGLSLVTAVVLSVRSA
jgi:transposase